MNAHGIRNRFPLAKIFLRIAGLRLSPKKQGVAKPIVLQHLEFSVYWKKLLFFSFFFFFLFVDLIHTGEVGYGHIVDHSAVVQIVGLFLR